MCPSRTSIDAQCSPRKSVSNPRGSGGNPFYTVSRDLAASMTTINDLSAPLITHIFSFTSAKDCCRASCAQKAWRPALEDDRLWETFCREEFALRSPLAFKRQELASYRQAFTDWEHSIGKYGSLGRRAAVAWQQIEDVLAHQHPSILASLRPGAEEEDLDKLSQRLGMPLPDAFRAMYRFHDGQQFAPPFAFWGLFGWFNVYHAVHSTSMLPLKKICLLLHNDSKAIFCSASPEAFQEEGGPLDQTDSEHVVSILEHRQMCVSMSSGDVFTFANRVGTCANAGLLLAGDGGSDHVLRWFEAYATALSTGYFQMGDGWDLVREDYGEVEALARVPRDAFKGISIIPRLPPGQVEACTRGIKVAASVVILPDNPMSRSVTVHEYAYSIRFTLLPPEEQLRLFPRAQPLASAQLLSRHWVILDERGQCTDTVEGEAVIGKYPHLTQAKPTFEYQSCTNLPLGSMGSMAGHFTFVEGSIANPTGRPFDVQCPRFYLTVPEWIY